MATSSPTSPASQDSLSPRESSHGNQRSKPNRPQSGTSLTPLFADRNNAVESESELEQSGSNGYKLWVLGVATGDTVSKCVIEVSSPIPSFSSASSGQSRLEVDFFPSESKSKSKDGGITVVNRFLLLPWDERESLESEVLRFNVSVVAYTNAVGNTGTGPTEEEANAEVVTEAAESKSEVSITIEHFSGGNQVATVLDMKPLDMRIFAVVERESPYQTHPLFQEEQDLGSPGLLEVSVKPIALPASLSKTAWLYISPEDELPNIQLEHDDLFPLRPTSKGVLSVMGSKRKIVCCVPAPSEVLFVKLVCLNSSYELKALANAQSRVAPGEGIQEVELMLGQDERLQLGITAKHASFALPVKGKKAPVATTGSKPAAFDLEQELSRCQVKLVSAESRVSELEGIVQKLQRKDKDNTKHITELANQVEERSGAIRKLGQVVADLRKDKTSLVEEKKSLEHRLKLREREMDAEVQALQDDQNAPNPAGVERNPDVAELQQKLRVLSRRYHSERVNNAEVLKRLEAVSKASRKLQTDRDYVSNLERAHREQARYIQYLQAEAPKVKVYKKTIKRQEENIRKLQELLEAQVDQHKRGGRVSFVASRDGLEGDDSTRSQKQHLEGQRKTSRTIQNAKGAAVDLNNEAMDLTREEEERADALEEKLVENARVFAKQIAALKTKLMQYEAKFDIDEDSDFSEDA